MKIKFFYGYRIVAVLFFANAVTAGCMFYTFSLFVSSLQTDFSWGRGDIMVASTIMSLVMGCSAPLVGRLVSLHGAKRVIIIGATIGGLGFLILTQMQYLWHYYIGYTLIGLGSGAAGPIAATTVVSNWFRKRRGTAIGIMSTGIGAGGLILAPVFGGYFIPNFGWQTSYLVYALLMWAIIPLTLFVIREKPSDMGLYPDDTATDLASVEAVLSPANQSGMTLKMALATTTFWLIVISFFASSFSQGGILQNQSPYLEEIGFSLPTIANAIAIIGLGSLIGKFLFGWMCDRMPVKYVWCISLCLQLASIAIIFNINSTSSGAMLWAYAILMGLGFGGWLPSMSMFISTHFGLTHYSIIFGMIGLAQGLGGAFGPIFAGYTYDVMHTYQLAFTVFLALYAISIPMALAISRPRVK